MKRTPVTIFAFVCFVLVVAAVPNSATAEPSESASLKGLPESPDAGAIAEIEKLGGKVELDRLEKAVRVVGVDFRRRGLNAAALNCLKGLSRIRRLNLGLNPIGDEGLHG